MLNVHILEAGRIETVEVPSAKLPGFMHQCSDRCRRKPALNRQPLLILLAYRPTEKLAGIRQHRLGRPLVQHKPQESVDSCLRNRCPTRRRRVAVSFTKASNSNPQIIRYIRRRYRSEVNPTLLQVTKKE